jgi:hypothetical protein
VDSAFLAWRCHEVLTPSDRIGRSWGSGPLARASHLLARGECDGDLCSS